MIFDELAIVVVVVVVVVGVVVLVVVKKERVNTFLFIAYVSSESIRDATAMRPWLFPGMDDGSVLIISCVRH